MLGSLQMQLHSKQSSRGWALSCISFGLLQNNYGNQKCAFDVIAGRIALARRLQRCSCGQSARCSWSSHYIWFSNSKESMDMLVLRRLPQVLICLKARVTLVSLLTSPARPTSDDRDRHLTHLVNSFTQMLLHV